MFKLIDAEQRSSTSTKVFEATLAVVSLYLLTKYGRGMLCGILFRCGCVWAPPFGVGAANCNVRDPNIPTSQQCPWCRARGLAKESVALHMYAYVGFFVAWVERLPLLTRWSIGLLTWLFSGVVIGLVFKFILEPEYPHFLFF